ncbi:MAG: hypothetical protein H7831_04780 [Magnetococcus sp. WYHC-3]
MAQQRTVFIIAHRLSALRQCHRLLVMEQGRLIERGTHEELLKLNGWYARMWRKQSGHATELAPRDLSA